MYRVIVGAIIGAVITYLLGALVGWSFSPAHWHWLWRFFVVAAMIFWALVGGSLGYVYHITDEEEDD